MKKPLKFVGAAVAALAIATIPAMTASAVTAITQTATITADFRGQESSAVSPDGNIQVILDNNGSKVLFAYADSETVVEVSDSGNDFSEPWSATFSPDGSTLYVSDYDTDIIIVDVATASVSTTIPDTHPCSENQMIGLSPDGKYLVLNDDCTDTYVYDVTNNYAQVGTDFDTTDDVTGVFFPNSTTAYLATAAGSIFVVDLTTGSQTDEWVGGNDSVGSCANADASVVAIVPSGSSGDLQFIDPATGELLGAADFGTDPDFDSGKACAFTGNGKVLVTDYSRTPAVVYVVNDSTYEYEETVDVDLGTVIGQDPYSNEINVMAGCKAFVTGYYGNIGVLTLPSDYCPSVEPTLPNTGASASVIGSSIAVSAGLLMAGSIALIMVRRRQHS